MLGHLPMEPCQILERGLQLPVRRDRRTRFELRSLAQALRNAGHGTPPFGPSYLICSGPAIARTLVTASFRRRPGAHRALRFHFRVLAAARMVYRALTRRPYGHRVPRG